MIRPLTIAHTSDVHLIDGDEGANVRAAFARVVDAVLLHEAGLFLIAGDLFDHNRICGDVIDFVYAQLARVKCPTVIISGNHDNSEQDAVLARMDFGRAGAHVMLIDDAGGVVLEFPELHATVWGRCMEDHHPAHRPLAGFPSRTRDLWHIGMAHGFYSDDANADRSSLITAAEIGASGFDYLALGHVHCHRQLRHGATLAVYPGAPVPYGRDETGSMAIVRLHPGVQPRILEHPIGTRGELESESRRDSQAVQVAAAG
ncbi:MAG: DNA repair exonuclease [Betaproteobacteria bacterium]|nr:DNA repair exonuclease [Betaproteobacteria bacterium]